MEWGSGALSLDVSSRRFYFQFNFISQDLHDCDVLFCFHLIESCLGLSRSLRDGCSLRIQRSLHSFNGKVDCYSYSISYQKQKQHDVVVQIRYQIWVAGCGAATVEDWSELGFGMMKR